MPWPPRNVEQLEHPGAVFARLALLATAPLASRPANCGKSRRLTVVTGTVAVSAARQTSDEHPRRITTQKATQTTASIAVSIWRNQK